MTHGFTLGEGEDCDAEGEGDPLPVTGDGLFTEGEVEGLGDTEAFVCGTAAEGVRVIQDPPLSPIQ